MGEQEVVAHQMMDQLGRQPETNQGGNPNGLEVDLKYLKFAEFRKANPPSFKGAFDLDKAEEWVKAMERVFSVLARTDHQKVAFATYVLEVDAEFWWNGMKRLLGGPKLMFLTKCSRAHFIKSISPLQFGMPRS